jgi:trans-o-hydroxybenzylidenepyruvate hydratase-aldolase
MITHFEGLYAIIPTPSKPGSDGLLATDTVDLVETQRVVDKLIQDGAAGLIALGTTGECATLSESDYEAFATCVLETVAGRIPTIMGSTALGGHQVAARLRLLQRLGADGTLLGLPMWQPLTLGEAVAWYSEVSEAFPEIAVMVYANARAFRFDFSQVELWQQLALQAPSVVAAKMSRPKNLPELIEQTSGRINFMPNESTVHTSFAIAPDSITACWATAAAMGPEPALAIMNAVRRGDQPEIARLAAAIRWANEPLDICFKDPEIFAKFNIQAEKTRINAAGYCNAGPFRPPYTEMPADYAAGAKECARRWNQLRANGTAEATAGA